jgi:hypothetical protein
MRSDLCCAVLCAVLRCWGTPCCPALPCLRSFRGVDLPKLPFNLGVRVMEVLTAFGAQEAAQQVQAVLSAAGAATVAAAAAAAAGSDATSSPQGGAAASVPSMRAFVAAADTPAATAGADEGGANTRGGQGHPPQQHQQQHLHAHHQQQQVIDAAALAALAAAAAAVPVPQATGPCLTLRQLLQYAVSLLQAVLPLLGQMLSQAAAAEAAGASAHGLSAAGFLAAGVAYEQQLRAVVQQLEQLGHQMGQQQWQQQQQQWQLTVRGELLRMGVQLVELCSVLLHDEPARFAVSQRLMQHASEFVSEAAGYLICGQQQQEGIDSQGPAVMLQQLTAALQHLQYVLIHATQAG